MAEIAVLYFQDGDRPPSWILEKNGIWGHSDPCMANIDQHAKFGANRSINSRDIAVLYFQDGGRPPSSILEKK